MKPKEIQDLLKYIADTGLEEVNIETEQIKISVKKTGYTSVAPPVESTIQQPVQTAPQMEQASEKSEKEDSQKEQQQDEENLVAVKSPMIGTFYRSANPESDPYVNIGDHVNKGDTVCIIEAMKLFNEIESEVSGKVVKVMVENATPVEYDQPLFLIDPNA